MTNGLEPHQESAHVYYLSCVPLFKSITPLSLMTLAVSYTHLTLPTSDLV